MKHDLEMSVSEMLLYLNHLTCLLARDDFIEFNRSESFKTYIMVPLLHKSIVVVQVRIHRLQKVFCRFQAQVRKLRPDQNENILLIMVSCYKILIYLIPQKFYASATNMLLSVCAHRAHVAVSLVVKRVYRRFVLKSQWSTAFRESSWLLNSVEPLILVSDDIRVYNLTFLIKENRKIWE
jgi:hypothetical protein